MNKSDRLLPWLKLGEAVYSLSLKRNPTRIFVKTSNSQNLTAKQLSDLVAKCLNELTEILYQGEDKDRLKFLLHLGDNPRNEIPRFLCIALVIWMRLGVARPDSSIGMVCTMLADVLDGTKHENILAARRVYFSLVHGGILASKDGEVCPVGIFSHYLCSEDMLLLRTLNTPSQDIQKSESETTSKSGKRQNNLETAFKEYVKKLVVPRPMELDTLIRAEGYVGQETARKAICLSAYRHVKRLKAIHLEGKDPNTLPKRDCLLFIGDTGSGKTHLCEIVFDRLLKLPTVIWNTANLTDAGYISGKVEHLLVKLFSSAGNNTLIAQTGVIVLDEVDKTASTNTGVMPGERINRDVSGESVQKVLLKLLEGGQLSVPNVGSGNQAWDFNARDTLIVGCGAFSALRNQKNVPALIGFGTSGKHQARRTKIGTEDLVRYGLTEEFIGRFGNIISFNQLKRDDLMQILQRTIGTRYLNELNEIAVEFSVAPEVLDLLVDRALSLKTGARSLSNALSEIMQDALYEVYSVDGVKSLRLVSNGGEIGYELVRRASKRSSKSPTDTPSPLSPLFNEAISAV